MPSSGNGHGHHSRKPPRPDPAGGLGALSSAVLYTGRARLALIRDLALGEWTASEIADQLGLPAEDIVHFADFHAEDIAEVRAALAGQLAIETAGLWIAKKHLRIAEYQAEVERLDEFLSELRAKGVVWSRSHRDMLATKVGIFRQVAEELGAYPQRSAAPARQGSAVHYIIETDADDLEALT